MRRRAAGFTLIEIIVSMVVIGVVIAGLVSLLGLIRYSADPVISKQAEAVAESIMDEVRLAAFTYCDAGDSNLESATSAASCTTPEVIGPESGNTRPYDNVNDYHALCAAPTTTDILSNTLPGGYQAKVCITPLDAGGDVSFTGGATTVDVAKSLKIVVTVTRGNESFTLTGWRARYAPNAL